MSASSAPTLADLLGSQVDAFHSQLHSQSHTQLLANASSVVTSPLLAPQSNGKKKSKSSAAASSSGPSSQSQSILHAPFTHTIAQPSLLTSILHQPSSVAFSGLLTSLDTAHSLLTQLLPKEVEETPKPAEFHSLFMKYLDACAGGVKTNTNASTKEAEGTKDKKRKRAEEKENAPTTSAALPSSSPHLVHAALHTVSTTVIGRLAARCIQLLSLTPITSEGEFDAKLLQSPSSYWSVLFKLLRSDSLSARFTPSLYSLLTKHSALPLIECALVHLHDASERDLVQVAKYALDHLPQPTISERQPELPTDLLGASSSAAPVTQPSKKKRKKNARNVVTAVNELTEPIRVIEVPGGPFAVILDLLLTSPVSANFLRHSLGALSATHAHKLLLYLYAWTLRYWFHTESEVHQVLHEIAQQEDGPSSSSTVDDVPSSVPTFLRTASTQSNPPTKASRFRIPSFSQVIHWLNILLDAIDFMRVGEKEEKERKKREENGGDGMNGDESSDASLELFTLVSSLASHISHHHLQFLERSQDLKGFIQIFAQMKRHPNSIPLPHAPMPDYDVEVLELSS